VRWTSELAILGAKVPSEVSLTLPLLNQALGVPLPASFFLCNPEYGLLQRTTVPSVAIGRSEARLAAASPPPAAAGRFQRDRCGHLGVPAAGKARQRRNPVVALVPFSSVPAARRLRLGPFFDLKTDLGGKRNKKWDCRSR